MHQATEYLDNYNVVYQEKKRDCVTFNETQSSVIIKFNNFRSLNKESSKYVFTRLKKYLFSGKGFIFNLEGIENIDAQGLALFLHLNKKLKSSKAELVLTNPSNSIQKIFWITEIDRLIKIKKSS